ncbi:MULTISPECIES: hypothetical protein [unclassified Pseudomonas]|uniref:hypothetical protein n=7 Tax=Pseudomonas TaxID=286 RepID=UPI000C86A48D|nr:MULTISPECIES: hypothetical protein [unclassified Pseudomonas]MDQ0668753.1 hypothetical protein [Pseudomonas sp. W2I6]PMU22045.1 hypothetical protein C1X90_19975 [Pseudomonas sp. GP01-A9]PMU27462.1 hypothetical protein C1X88_19765 [Pseudomonas sp. GP01-A13]PMU31100.1 hypothetical protein C1X89_33055 [Pseudomonas sp. GP01-A8]PMU51761.1 hypothetical protein C1X85_20510 [Pseudomonas sp. GP01-A6]
MKTAYINETGVKPWNGVEQIDDSQFSTLTLIDHDFRCVWDSWCNVAECLVEEWPIKREWRSIGWGDFYSRTEEYLLKKELAGQIKNGDLFGKNDSTNIYSIIKNIPTLPRDITNSALEGSSETILIMQKSVPSIEQLWTDMTIFEKKVTTKNIKTFLEIHPQTVLCRFFDSETHAAAQFISMIDVQEKLVSAIQKNEIREITQREVYSYIHT